MDYKIKKSTFLYYFIEIIKYGIIKGSKSAVYMAIRDGDDLALPKHGKRLPSVWLEAYISGSIY